MSFFLQKTVSTETSCSVVSQREQKVSFWMSVLFSMTVGLYVDQLVSAALTTSVEAFVTYRYVQVAHICAPVYSSIFVGYQPGIQVIYLLSVRRNYWCYNFNI